MEKKYNFVQVPTNLFILLDNNCRSMLFTLIQLSTYYADEDGWFFRTWQDLEDESNLSINLCMATVQTLFNHYLIEARPTGYGRGKKPNYYKVNFDNFTNYEEIQIEACIKNPDLKIRTVPYKGGHFKLNLVRETVNNVVKNTVKSENNINNIDNEESKDNIYNESNMLHVIYNIGETVKSENKKDFEEEKAEMIQYIREQYHQKDQKIEEFNKLYIPILNYIRRKYPQNCERLCKLANIEFDRLKQEYIASISLN